MPVQLAMRRLSACALVLLLGGCAHSASRAGEMLESPPDIVVFAHTRSHVAAHGCQSVEGALAWDGPDSAGQRAATLGRAPFTYAVTLVLDGQTYHGAATWPDEVIPDYEPNASLTFTPPLPAVAAAGS